MRNILLVSGVWALLLWIAIPDLVYSEMQENTGAYTLGEVVVSADKEIVESVGTVREVTSEDIQNKDARTLDESLQLLPGMNIRTSAEGVPRVDLRGFRSRHVILLLDGIPFNSTFDGQFDPSLIPTENIAKTKVAYGNHSVLYGDGGLGGIINVITKRGKEGFHAMASGEAEEGDSYLGRFNLSGGQEKVDFFLSGSMYDMNRFRLSDDFKPTPVEDGDKRDNSDKRRNNFFANVNFAPNDKLLIGAVFNYVNGEFGIPPSTINDPEDPFADKPKFERIDNFEGYAGHLSLSYDVPGPLSLRTWVFFNQMREEDNQYDNNNYNSIDDPYVKGSLHQDNKTKIRGGAVQATCDLKSAGLFTIGLNGRREEFFTDGMIKDVRIPRTRPPQYAFSYFKYDRDLNIYSAALEYEVHPVKNAGTVVGYSHNWLEMEDGKNDDAGSFMVGAYYDILKDTRIRGSFARQIRFPAIRQIYEEGTGNPDLTTEKSNNYELAIEQKLPGNSKVALIGFLIDVKDYIEKDEATDTFQNNDKYRFQGFELTGETRFLKTLFLGAGYTYLDTEDRSPNTEKDELQNRPKHKLTFESKYYFNFGFSAYMNIIYVADQVFYSKKTPLLKKSLNDYALVNLKLDQALLKNRVNLYVGVDNLFDQDYEQGYGYPQPGRFIYGGVTVSL